LSCVKTLLYLGLTGGDCSAPNQLLLVLDLEYKLNYSRANILYELSSSGYENALLWLGDYLKASQVAVLFSSVLV
jgi:hypothetical protein